MDRQQRARMDARKGGVWRWLSKVLASSGYPLFFLWSRCCS